jgi:copper(I)-binding protein
MTTPKLEAHYTTATAGQRRTYPGCKAVLTFATITNNGLRQWIDGVTPVTGKAQAHEVCATTRATPHNF